MRSQNPKFLKSIILECVSFFFFFCESKKINKFYIDLSIVVLGAIHGLVLLPVLLSMFGGEGMALMAEFDEDGFAWSTGNDWRGLGRNNRGLLIDDNDSSDQVFITDLPSESDNAYHAQNRMSIE